MPDRTSAPHIACSRIHIRRKLAGRAGRALAVGKRGWVVGDVLPRWAAIDVIAIASRLQVHPGVKGPVEVLGGWAEVARVAGGDSDVDVERERELRVQEVDLSCHVVGKLHDKKA